MSDSCACLHLLLGPRVAQALDLAMPAIQPGDWIVFADGVPDISLQDLPKGIEVRQAVDRHQACPAFISDSDLAGLLCRAQQTLSWW